MKEQREGKMRTGKKGKETGREEKEKRPERKGEEYKYWINATSVHWTK